MTEIQTELGAIDLPEKEAKYVDYKGYRGNTLLKRAGVAIEWTPELIAEFRRCKDDYVYFIEKYVKVINVDEGLVPFKLRTYQKELLDNIHHNRRTITVMARQSGKSTAVTAYLLWYILFNPYKTVVLLANKAETAREILGKAQFAYLYIPAFLQQGVGEGGWNKGSMTLENHSRAFASSTSDDAIRGYTANMLILDETAHIEHWDEFSKSTLPVVTAGKTTKLVMISTPKGLNHFHAYWSKAILKDIPKDQLPQGMKWNGYVPLMVNWRQVPGRDQAWYDETMQELNFDAEKFQQEFECEFMGSSGTLIAGQKLRELVAQIPIYQRDGLSKYANPVKENNYVITVDVAEGKLRDYTCFQVTDITQMPYQQVATYRSNETTPGDVAEIIHLTALAYNNAMVLVEFENLGPEVSAQLFNSFEYENLLYTRSSGRAGKEITTEIGKAVDKGIKMSIATKATGCQVLKLLIEGNQYIINDLDTIQELATFSRKNNTYKAEEGKHDDTVMALVVFAWLSNQKYFKQLTEIDTIAKLREKRAEDIEEQLLPFGFIDRGDPVGSYPTTAQLHKELWYAAKPIKDYTPYVHTNEEDEPIEWLPNF